MSQWNPAPLHASSSALPLAPPALHRRRSVLAGDDVLLQCELRSNLATPRWTLNGRELRAVSPVSGYRLGSDGLLILAARAEHSGSYRCFAVENAVSVLLRLYSVSVHSDRLPPPTVPTANTQPPAVSSPIQLPTAGGASEREFPPTPTTSPPPLPDDLLTSGRLEALYLPLVSVLGGLSLVLTVVLIYISFCRRRRQRKLSQQRHLQVLGASERKRSSYLELRTISGHCNGRQERRSISSTDSFFSRSPPPAPPLPTPPPPPPGTDYANGLSATIPVVLRKMNNVGSSSYMLLRQADQLGAPPLYHSFTEELNRILEQRNHSQMDLLTEQSSV